MRCAANARVQRRGILGKFTETPAARPHYRLSNGQAATLHNRETTRRSFRIHRCGCRAYRTAPAWPRTMASHLQAPPNDYHFPARHPVHLGFSPNGRDLVAVGRLIRTSRSRFHQAERYADPFGFFPKWEKAARMWNPSCNPRTMVWDSAHMGESCEHAGPSFRVRTIATAIQ